MTVNESFLGQYSVFCVFGSVVGCVIVPLIAQVIQQQSVECVILSAIVISLTAAHLKGKTVSLESSHIKVPCKDSEKKKLVHSKKPQKICYAPVQEVSYITMNEQHAQEYIQQKEIIKNCENERRLEEKKLKKRLKRDERLKQKQKELKKEKEQEDKDKGKRDQKENLNKQRKSKSNLDTFCSWSKSNFKSKHVQQPVLSNYSMCNRIPRFERCFSANTAVFASDKFNLSSGSFDNSLQSDNSRLLSCSSSSDSSILPHKTISGLPRTCSKPAWNVSNNGKSSASTIFPPTLTHNSSSPVSLRSRFNDKDVDSVTLGESPIKSLGFSTSFFCTEPDISSEIPKNKEVSFSDQYSLFGSQPFGSSLIK
ncbi:myotubularin-related protein DDB_G0290005 isoform X1 [Hydra vulgaris]|uniref:myotubularin-related protein DDB_G0290005 isoform X1 n=1 Tax=Hydra vulgaris TaxID=6087 RepID=UPI0006410C7F|nr:myotubularin-related protein DDB_G0290005 [Hydra vulgaris]